MKRSLALLAAAIAVALTTIGLASGSSAANHAPEKVRSKAIADARKRLRSFAPPPGSHRVGSLPKSLHLNGPFSRPGSPRYVDVHAFWVSSGSVDSMRDYLAGHTPPGADHSISGEMGSRTGIYRWDYGYAWPELPDVADLRELTVGVVARPGGGSALRADSQATWIEPRPVDEQIPSGVAYLEATETLEGHGTRVVGTASAAKIEAVSRLVDGFGIVQNNGGVECGAIPSERVTLKAAFRASPGGPVLAETEQRLPVGYCDFIGLTIGDKDARALYDEGGALTKSLQNLFLRKYKTPLTADIEGF
jgi:hypothetical protein